MPRKVFTAGEILTAADVNTNLMDQSVMVFDDASARTTAIPTPVEGMVTYLKDTDAVEKFDGDDFVGVATPPAILQVVSTSKTDAFSTSSTTPVDISGASVTITPFSTDSKVFVSFSFPFESGADNSVAAVQLLRDSTVIGGGAVAGSRLPAMSRARVNRDASNQLAGEFLDSPATTSAVTYSLKIFGDFLGGVGAGGSNLYVCRTSLDTDSATSRNTRTSLNITAMEVAG